MAGDFWKFQGSMFAGGIIGTMAVLGVVHWLQPSSLVSMALGGAGYVCGMTLGAFAYFALDDRANDRRLHAARQRYERARASRET